jgi:drug/metabolite transporter (DMT)-like permease
LRITLAALTLAVIRLMQRKPFSAQAGDRGAILRLGVVGVGWSFLLFTAALAYTSVAHAVFIGALIPMVVLLLARVEGQERITIVKITGLVTCLLGVVLLAMDKAYGADSHWIGDLLAFAGLWSFAYFTVGGKRVADRYDSFSLITFSFLIAALFCLPFLLWAIMTVDWGPISTVAWLSLLYSATIGSAGAYLAYYYSLRILTASQVAAFQYVQPVLSTMFGVVFLAETWGAGFAMGAALILLGMLLAERR